MESTALTDAQIREKLLVRGAGELSDAELLSIVIREGAKGSSAIEVGTSLLERFSGNLRELSAAGIPALRVSAGMGLQRAATVAAAMELARRISAQEGTAVERIAGTEDVVRHFQSLLSGLKHEEFWALYLNSSGRILDKVRISQGGTSSTVVDNKLIIKRALEKLASSIIIVHNHPSGSLDPTQDDMDATYGVRDAAALFDMELTDHVIIAPDGGYLSFNAAGLLF